jgi:hypothetical protein
MEGRQSPLRVHVGTGGGFAAGSDFRLEFRWLVRRGDQSLPELEPPEEEDPLVEPSLEEVLGLSADDVEEAFFWYASEYQPPPLRVKADELMSLVTFDRQVGHFLRTGSDRDWRSSNSPHFGHAYS